jgi:hypothetical protein
MTDQTPSPSPTQIAYPWKATVRTVIAVVVGVAVVAPLALDVIQSELVGYLPPETLAWLAWAVGLAVAISGTVTRIMAIPLVNAWLTKLGLGATPKTDA